MCAVPPPCSLLPQVLSKIAHKSTHFLCLKTTQCQAHTFPIKACRDKTGNTHLLSNKRNEPENTRLKGKHPKRWNLVSLRKWVFCFLSTARQLTFAALIKVDWLWNNARPIFFLCRLHGCKCECKLDGLSIYGMYVSAACVCGRTCFIVCVKTDKYDAAFLNCVTRKHYECLSHAEYLCLHAFMSKSNIKVQSCAALLCHVYVD